MRNLKDKARKLLIASSVCLVLAILTIIIIVCVECFKSKKNVLNEIQGISFERNMLSWDNVEGATGYEVKVGDEFFYCADTRFSLDEYTPNEYMVVIIAKSKHGQKYDSYSDTLKVRVKYYGLEVTAMEGEIFSKIYDGTTDANIQLVKGIHYELKNLNYGEDVDINITGVNFNSTDVLDASEILAVFDAELIGNDSINYGISQDSFSLSAKINPKDIIFEPDKISKQFLDNDELNLITEIKGEKIAFDYIREEGEEIGFYDILSVTSKNANFNLQLAENGGDDKFEITKRKLSIKSLNKPLSKIYDGSTYLNLSDITEGVHFETDSVIGYQAKLELTRAEFQSCDVSNCTKAIVNFSNRLLEGEEFYIIEAGSFNIPAFISPKQISVIPDNFSICFGEEENFIQQIYSEELDENFLVRFYKSEGKTVGIYDIVGAESESFNYSVSVVSGTGKDKVEILRRKIKVAAINSAVLTKTFDNTNTYFGTVKVNEHYVLENLIDDFEADIKISAVIFNSFNVCENGFATVYYGYDLAKGFEYYEIDEGSFNVNAEILPKILDYEPLKLQKQFGNDDPLVSENIFDAELGFYVAVNCVRTAGEAVGVYDFLIAETDNPNYKINLINGRNKFEIVKRIIAVVPSEEKLTKTFDNNDLCSTDVLKDIHYTIAEELEDFPVSIKITQKNYNDKNTSAKYVKVFFELSENNDIYVLSNSYTEISAQILPKPIRVVPKEIQVQFGDGEVLDFEVVDTDLNITVPFTYLREQGNDTGYYDLIGAISKNNNYSVELEENSGINKYIITARKLNIKTTDGIQFNKKYDGTTDCSVPIIQNFHYELENLIGGSEVSLQILSKKYNSPDVLTATKVIVHYSALLEGADGQNYETTEGYFEFFATVSPRQLEITPFKNVKKYSENEDLKQSYYDVLTDETIMVSFGREEGENVGFYDIILATSNNPNFAFEVVDGYQKFEIIKNDITITAFDKTVVYNSQSHALETPSSNPAKPLNVLYTKHGQSVYSTEKPIKAGIYDVLVAFDGDDNYNEQVVVRTLTIERTESVLINNTPNNYIYDGSVKPILIQLNHNEAQIDISRTNLVNAGQYDNILVSVSQTENYKAASILISVTIAKKVLYADDIILPVSRELTYGQRLAESVIFPSNNVYAYEWVEPSLIPSVHNDGFEVRLITKDLTNYDYSNLTLSYTIPLVVNKAVIEVQMPKASSVYEGQSLNYSELIYDSTYGMFEWTAKDFVPSERINYCEAVFTPNDVDNYDWSHIPETYSVRVDVCFPVSFETFGGNYMDKILALEITAPPLPYKSGCVFEGWYLDEALTKPVVYPYSVDETTTFYALWRTKGLGFTLSKDKTYYIVTSDGTAVEYLGIPESFKGLPVKEIKANAFENNLALKRIYIPSSVTVIGDKAFFNCYYLTEIHLGQSIEKMTLGADWNKTKTALATDIHFECKACLYCIGSEDCHINCPYCKYCGTHDGEHESCNICGTACTGDADMHFCKICGACRNCKKQCLGCGVCDDCNIANGKLVCPKCHWCDSCNTENSYEYCPECGECEECFDLCADCGKCSDHCACE